MTKPLTILVSLALGAAGGGSVAAQCPPEFVPAPSIPYTVVDSWPHDPTAFTQGLDFRGEALFESTGLNGESSLRRVRLRDGTVLRKTKLADRFFGEGIVVWRKKIFWLTWQHERGFRYRARDFDRTGSFSYSGEGWGLTHNGTRLLMSNGTDVIHFRDPTTFESVRSIGVTANGQPLPCLNELEWIDGEIWANVWQTDRVARIDPGSGAVTGWLDLTQLAEAERAQGDVDVLNGIAYMASEDRLFVTGKLWAHVYEIRLA